MGGKRVPGAGIERHDGVALSLMALCEIDSEPEALAPAISGWL